MGLFDPGDESERSGFFEVLALLHFIRIFIGSVVFAILLVPAAVGRVNIPALAALTTIIHDDTS